ncbi:inositol monophosphatase family protein [Nesterenkonia sp. CL21]|uniref:inositol monophosphatase family protein n=1 Tax=unclassified Nesterenkonia TaxID=2629769 RepID=UPI002878E863|nr:inositol monophosphatase family protein [Nesterenkonia sp. CL21]MDS2172630.1 inositol monophosphatase family protein [Nesterenkonia sp. CL21]
MTHTHHDGATDDSLGLARIARRAAEAVADDIRQAFTETVEVEHKTSEFDPVTEVDRSSERRIREILAEATPHAAIAGEEFGATEPTDSVGSASLRWHIDPIDGTHNFIAGIPYISTSVAAEVEGVIVAGAVHDPLRRETFWASDDQAWVDDSVLASAAEDPGRPGVLTSQPFQGLRSTGAELEELVEICRSFGIVRNPGSFALQVAHVAAGRASGAFELTGAAPWDIAGGIAVAQATGCTHLRLGQAPPGFGDWASHSYLITRDPARAAEIGPRLARLMAHGEVPEVFAKFMAI